jgi:hypothetical protein
MKVAYFVEGPSQGDSDVELFVTQGVVPRQGEAVVYRDRTWIVDRVIYIIRDADEPETAISLRPAV